MINENLQLVEEDNSANFINGPGLQLQQRRNQVGLSIEEVAARLCLRHSVIEALEADDYSALSGHVFARGYLRAYAGVLQVDADEIIMLFNTLGIVEEARDKNLWQAPKVVRTKESPVKWLIMLIFISSLVLAGLWWNASNSSKISTPVNVSAGPDSDIKTIHKLEAQLPEVETVNNSLGPHKTNIVNNVITKHQGKKV